MDSSILSFLLITLQPLNVFACFAGAVIGTLVGILPGLGPAAAMALVLPLTLKLGPTAGLIMLAGIYYGSMYGGSTTSILVNVPGEPASVVTTLDGYAMARKGRAGADISGQQPADCGRLQHAVGACRGKRDRDRDLADPGS